MRPAEETRVRRRDMRGYRAERVERKGRSRNKGRRRGMVNTRRGEEGRR